MKAGKRKKVYRKWKGVADEFTNLPVSRQRKWQLRMQKEGKCPECARPFNGKPCPLHPSKWPNSMKKWGVIGPCIANMLRAGMKIPEIMEFMNVKRADVFGAARRQGVDVSNQHLRVGRPLGGTANWNLRIFLKEPLNEPEPSPLQAPTK